MLSEVDTSAAEGDWLTQLRSVVRSYHQTLAAHSQLARVYSGRVRIGPHGVLLIERTIGLLLQGDSRPPRLPTPSSPSSPTPLVSTRWATSHQCATPRPERRPGTTHRFRQSRFPRSPR
ncbi:MAG: TetR/AcrR family transcriptional regulator C-terminal domain-containing protein [Pseudonocardiaceae bacterium]